MDSGPHQCGAKNDFTLFEQALQRRVLPLETVVTDRGYSEHTCIAPNNFQDISQPLICAFRSAIRPCYKTLKYGLKVFNIFMHCFGYDHEVHSYVLFSVAILLHFSFAEEPLFSVNEEM